MRLTRRHHHNAFCCGRCRRLKTSCSLANYERRPQLHGPRSRMLDHVARSRRVMLRRPAAPVRRRGALISSEGWRAGPPINSPKPTAYTHLDDVDEEDTRRDQGPTRCELWCWWPRKAALEVCATLRLANSSKHASKGGAGRGGRGRPRDAARGPAGLGGRLPWKYRRRSRNRVSVRVDRSDVTVDSRVRARNRSYRSSMGGVTPRGGGRRSPGRAGSIASISFTHDQADVLLYQNWETERNVIERYQASLRPWTRTCSGPTTFLDAHGSGAAAYCVVILQRC